MEKFERTINEKTSVKCEIKVKWNFEKERFRIFMNMQSRHTNSFKLKRIVYLENMDDLYELCGLLKDLVKIIRSLFANQ